jgi:tRNA G26 N,N-dimethylase Trm1
VTAATADDECYSVWILWWRLGDASLVMYQSRDKQFDVVDLDPYVCGKTAAAFFLQQS